MRRTSSGRLFRGRKREWSYSVTGAGFESRDVVTHDLAIPSTGRSGSWRCQLFQSSSSSLSLSLSCTRAFSIPVVTPPLGPKREMTGSVNERPGEAASAMSNLDLNRGVQPAHPERRYTRLHPSATHSVSGLGSIFAFRLAVTWNISEEVRHGHCRSQKPQKPRKPARPALRSPGVAGSNEIAPI